jgi:hypothetical protein
MSPSNRFLTAVLLLAVAQGPGAAHITDKLVVGMYPQPGTDGAPLRLLPSGTPLQVLQRKDGYSEVSLADDTRGWVASTYITEEKPAKAMLLETQAKLRQMGLELAALREKAAETPAGDGGAEAPLTATVAEAAPPSAREAQLRHALEQAEGRIAELEGRLAERPVAEGAEQDLQTLRRRVQRALDLLAEAQGVEIEASEPAAAGPIARYQSWIVGLLALLLGFGGGMAFVDYRIRRRHGGFRI